MTDGTDNNAEQPDAVQSLLNRARAGNIYMIDLPDMTNGRNPKPMATLANLREIMRRLNWGISFDVIKKEMVFDIPALGGMRVDDLNNSAYAHIISEMAKFDMPVSSASNFMDALAAENPVNPVRAWVMSKPWDKTPRLEKFLQTITIDETKMRPAFARLLICKWMLSALTALANDDVGQSAHGVLVFQGRQGIGKTFWFKRLVGNNARWVQDGVTLNMENKDSVLLAVSHWMIELGELDSTFRKSDIAQLKSFITQQFDIIRRPYARSASKYPRTSVFFASVNDVQFLNDDTGNRRFWVLPVLGIDYKTNFDMQQVWAELAEAVYPVISPLLGPKELDELNASNKGFEPVKPCVERVMSSLNWDLPPAAWRWTTLTNLIFELDGTKGQLRERKEIEAALREFDLWRNAKSPRGGNTWERNRFLNYWLPPLIR